MSAQTFSIKFSGYWEDENKDDIPNKSGIYGVYAYTQTTTQKQNNKLIITKLIYIGESGEVRDRIKDHELQKEWKRHLDKGEKLCYNFAPITKSEGRLRVEAALINHHKPPVNTEYVESFPFDETTVNVSGEAVKLDSKFTVYRTET